MKKAPLLLAFPAIFLFLFFFRPLWFTLQRGLDASAWEWIAGPFVSSRLTGAFLQAVLSVALTLALALPLAWFHDHFNIQWGRLHLAMHAMPFVLPVFVIVFGIQAVTGGLSLSPLIAIAIAHAYYNYGFAARLLHTSLQRRPHVMEAAARTLGASPFRAFLRTSFPLLLPNLLAVSLLVFLFAFSSFGVVLYMGDGQISTLETLMYSVLRGAFARPERAAALGLLQLAINGLLLGAYMFLLRRQLPIPHEPQPAKFWVPANGIAWGLAGLAMVPALAVLVQGVRYAGKWSLAPWRALLDVTHPAHLPGFDLFHALKLTIGYALVSATLALALSLCLAYGARGRWQWAADGLAALPLGTSSLLIGVGYLLTFGVSGFVTSAGGRWLIVCAHALVAFPFTARVLLPAINQHDKRLDQAAQTLGATPWGVWLRVQLPLLRGPLAVATGFGLAMSFGDFGASLLLQSADNRALSVWIDSHGGVGAFNPLVRAQAVALSGLLMVMAAAAYLLVERGQRHA